MNALIGADLRPIYCKKMKPGAAMSSNDLAQFQASWQHAWAGLQLQPPPGLQQQLLAAYAEPQRHYHTQRHLAECLTHLAAARHLAQHPAEVELALWFHDAVYDVKGKDNELRSAQWATSALQHAGASDAICKRVHDLIMATCHTATPVEADAQLLVDIDLAILGASPGRFAEYDQQVRAEYSWVPALIYGFKRKQVLQSFLHRPQIYATAFFQERLEQQARDNLRQVA